MKTEHILVIRFSTLGDVALVVPVVYSLARQYPHIRITVLSRRSSRPLFEDLAPNVGFMEADIKEEYHGIHGLNALYRRLAAKQFTAVADLHNIMRSNFLRLRFNLGHRKVAHLHLHTHHRWHLTRRKSGQTGGVPSSLQNYVDVFEKLGYSVNIQFRSIFPPEGGDLSLLSVDQGRKTEGSSWIGVAPFAAGKGKACNPQWVETFIRRQCQEKPDSLIYLFEHGDQKAAAQVAAWCKKYPQCRAVSQVASGLRQELVLMSHLDMLYSSEESSYQQFAVLTDTPWKNLDDSQKTAAA